MPRKKKEKVVKSSSLGEGVKLPDGEISISKEKNQARVFDGAGNYVRTYSLEEHGKDFGKLAEGFAKKIGGSVR